MSVHLHIALDSIPFLLDIFIDHRRHMYVEVASRLVPCPVNRLLLVSKPDIALSKRIVLHVAVLVTLLLLQRLRILDLRGFVDGVDIGTGSWRLYFVFWHIIRQEITADSRHVCGISSFEFLMLLGQHLMFMLLVSTRIDICAALDHPSRSNQAVIFAHLEEGVFGFVGAGAHFFVEAAAVFEGGPLDVAVEEGVAGSIGSELVLDTATDHVFWVVDGVVVIRRWICRGFERVSRLFRYEY